MAVKLSQEVECPGGLEVSLQKRFDIKLQGGDILGEHILDEVSPVLLGLGNFGAEKAVYAQPYGVTELSGQGGKIAVTTQMLLDKGIFNPAYAILPRGLEGTMVRDLYSPTFAALASFDYAIPIHLGDINITPLLYLNRMVITPHFDYGYSRYPQRHLCSAGSSVTFQFGRLVWAIPVELGVDYSYNFGTLFSMMNENGSRVIRHSIKPVIKISF